MKFEAEIIRTAQRKLVSGDNQYEVVLRTNNPLVLDLGKLSADTIFTVSVGINKQTVYNSKSKGKSKKDAESNQI